MWQPVAGTSYGPFGATCSAPVTDVFGASLDQDFSIDGPVFAALVPQLASKDPEGLATLLAVIAIVIVPTIIIGSLLIEQALSTYAQIGSQKIDLGRIISDFRSGLPRPIAALVTCVPSSKS